VQGLREAEVMSIGGLAAADQTRVRGDKLDVVAVTMPSRPTPSLPNVSWCDTANIVQPGNNYVIRSFKGNLARMILDKRRVPKGFPTSFAKIARRKLIQLNNAGDLGDLTVPRGNRFEALKGNLAGRYSIRVNDQWRIVFRWTSVGPEEVEIRDYH
jgi:toxin HigB-1